jgi:glycine cleavage system aminomethyltransferase T
MRIVLTGSYDGSNWAENDFRNAELELSRKGHVVEGPASFSVKEDIIPGLFNLARLMRISQADAVVHVRRNGYTGEQTACEILFANMHGVLVIPVWPFMTASKEFPTETVVDWDRVDNALHEHPGWGRLLARRLEVILYTGKRGDIRG